MNTDKMLEVASLIEALPEEKFSMTVFCAKEVIPDEDEYGSDIVYLHPSEYDECNTFACIAGWAVLNEVHNHSNKKLVDQFTDRMSRYFWVDAGAEIFGLTHCQAEQLFLLVKNPECIWMTYSDEFDIPFLDEIKEDDSAYVLSSIQNKHAVKMLRGIASGKYVFPESENEGCTYWRRSQDNEY